MLKNLRQSIKQARHSATSCLLMIFSLLISSSITPLPLVAEDKGYFNQGWWRVEAGIAAGTYSGLVSRSGDLMGTGIIEYEGPLTRRATLSLRLMPLFIYDEESNTTEHEDGTSVRIGGNTLFGGGFGLAARIYSIPEEHRGFFAETGGSALFHSNRLEGNGSNINFLTGVGLGYKLINRWHAVFKYEHISNAGFSERNQSANVTGIGIGYSF